jgi:hypothetical protein
MMTADEKEWIDNATIEQLLNKWRFAPIGSAYFCEDQERTSYFQKVMNQKRAADHEAYVRASKNIGW